MMVIIIYNKGIPIFDRAADPIMKWNWLTRPTTSMDLRPLWTYDIYGPTTSMDQRPLWSFIIISIINYIIMQKNNYINSNILQTFLNYTTDQIKEVINQIYNFLDQIKKYSKLNDEVYGDLRPLLLNDDLHEKLNDDLYVRRRLRSSEFWTRFPLIGICARRQKKKKRATNMVRACKR